MRAECCPEIGETASPCALSTRNQVRSWELPHLTFRMGLWDAQGDDQSHPHLLSQSWSHPLTEASQGAYPIQPPIPTQQSQGAYPIQPPIPTQQNLMLLPPNSAAHALMWGQPNHSQQPIPSPSMGDVNNQQAFFRQSFSGAITQHSQQQQGG